MIRSIQAAAPPAPENTLIARSSGLRAITAIARNWEDAQQKFFAEGAVFDGIYKPNQK